MLHAEGYIAVKDTKLVALCDQNEVRLLEKAERLNIPRSQCYTDHKTMLAEANLDIVSIALPNALHVDVTLDALNAGAHVLCEKPLATSVADAQRMIDAAEANNRRLIVMYNKRYRPDMFWIREMLVNGKLGDVYHVHVSWRRESGIPTSGWFGQKAMAGGGPLFDLGVHVLDMALWALDYPAVQTVSGQVRTLFGPQGRKLFNPTPISAFDVEDGAVGFLRLKGGISMFLEATWAEHNIPGEDRMRVAIQGSEGTAVLDVPNYTDDDTLTYYTEMEGTPVMVKPKVEWRKRHGFTGYIDAVAEAILTDTPAPAEGAQGMITVGILEAIYESARQGREIAFEEIIDV